MSDNLSAGFYDLLHTVKLQQRLEAAGMLQQARWDAVDVNEVPHRLASTLAKELSCLLAEGLSSKKPDELLSEIDGLFRSPDLLPSLLEVLRPYAIQALRQIVTGNEFQAKAILPDTPLSVSALLTGSSRSPALRTQIIKELGSCTRADWLISFIRYSGLLPILPALKLFTSTANEDGSPRLRIATTSYMGATELKAVKALLELPNTELKISYDTRRTRLHAKAYLFHRGTGFSTAYIGSANLSKAALDEGLEWTAKVSQYETEHLWQHAVATFESHWEDTTEFTRCTPDDLDRLQEALQSEQGGTPQTDNFLPFFDLRPYQYQQVILDDIHAERMAGKTKHLVIAATGTGKTMVAAFDYKRFAGQSAGLPRLLYIAHREEILKQAQGAFRQVLRDGSFGEIISGNTTPNEGNHLFCTVQSWHSKGLDQLDPAHFKYVVLDEAHHAQATTYQALMLHIQPDSLLGLTATPERSDGKDIRDDFGGHFTHEIRLPEAVEQVLLVPFHYYGVPDLEGVDFSTITWKRGGYDDGQVKGLLESNKERAHWVLGQLDRYVNDVRNIRALGFCVSKAHAKFMAEICKANGIPAIHLDADSLQSDRHKAQRRLAEREINIIFTVDLYNEGVDIPSVDTVLFLRPTESLTVFLQQLGRGLRIHEDKAHLTVLDFIAPQHRNFSYAKRFRALSSRPNRPMLPQIESDMPFLPSGCIIHLERQAKEHVISNINAATNAMRGRRLLQELRELKVLLQGPVSLTDMVQHLHLDSPDEIYKKGLPHLLLAEADHQIVKNGLMGYDHSLAKGFRRLLLMDDLAIVEDGLRELNGKAPIMTESTLLLQSILWGNNRPESLQKALNIIDNRPGLQHDLAELFMWLLEHTVSAAGERFPAKTGPLALHASYSREQILQALGLGSFENPKASREGVLHLAERKLDLFFADINKSEADFSPTTMYEDYALTDRLFHWQSQSQTSDSSLTGRRYINHREQGYTPLLFIRERKTLENGLTAPYFFAGPLHYHKHEGSKPVTIIWEMEHPLPAKALSWARRVA
jgi:superfamily II DNA or RNA helicase/HKD family nuclease